ncbi:MAG TPA: TetR/AcrR family transcriptional regulator, partial [Thermomicrobiales bacterium]|nr:TetR/AcrR family transcriptional regulator [Thermomicrobiales bacterium]
GPTDADAATQPAALSADAPRRQRSDAKRNVVALLEAAKSVFARTGVDAPPKEITDLAGVGVGTLYRHFPRRSDLIVAVLQHEVDACASAATTLSAEHGPWEALRMWVGRFTEFVGTKRGLATALHSGDPAFDDLPRRLMADLEPALDELLSAAKASGDVRVDVTASDILLTVALMCQPVPGEDLRFSERMIRIFIEGLRHP